MYNKNHKRKMFFLTIVFFLLLGAFVFTVIYTNTKKTELYFKNQVEEYVEGNYKDLGLEKEDDFVIFSAKELYQKGIINSSTYKSNENSIIKITLNGNGEVDVEIYNKDIDNEEPSIILNGSTTMNLKYGDTFIEPGYTANDNIDGNITSSVTATGTVNTNKLGTYTITYTVKDSSNNKFSISRIVNVIDEEAPKITLNGNSVIYLQKGNKYNELGASALDNVDGDISNNITSTGTVDITKTGTYTISYTVKDSSNNSTRVYRTVIVIEYTAPTITLNGALVSNIIIGSTYTELGVSKVTDNYDTDLLNKVTITGVIDTTKLGTYYKLYKVTNSKGISSTVTRTINVVNPPAELANFTLSGSANDINIPGIFDENYTRNFSITNIIDQYNQSFSINNSDITWSVTSTSGVTIQDNGDKTATLSISKSATEGVITITVNIGSITKTININLTKVPVLYTYTINGYNEAVLPGNATTTNQYEVINFLDQYGEAINVSSDDITWGVTEVDGISILDNEDKTMNLNISNLSTEQAITISTTIGGVSKNLEVNLIKVPVLSSFSINGESSLTLVGGTTTSNYGISNIVDQYGENILIDNNDITWDVTSVSGISIQNNGDKTATLSIASSVVAQTITIEATINSVTQSFNVSIVKIPALNSFTINGSNTLSVLGNATTTSAYNLTNILDQYGDQFELSESITWSLVNNTDENISISNAGLLTMNNNVDYSKIITIRAEVSGIYDTLEVTLNKINVSSVDILNSSLTSVKNTTITMALAETKQLSATFLPINATIQSGAWSSSNSAKVTVVNGLITVVSGTNGETVTISYTIDGVAASVTINIQTSLYYNSSEGVNAPQLAPGMTPVKWSGTTLVSTTAADPDWYSYTATDKKWANAQTADGSYWVWIPRFVYKITSGWNVMTYTPGVDIQFSIDYDDTREGTITLDTGTTSNASNNKWTTHPAFTFGTDQIGGFWIAKFEPSGSTSALKSVPNVLACNTQMFTTFWNSFRGMENQTAYGWDNSGNNLDTHMIKNIEWGAVAYLTESSYGKSEQVWINNSSTATFGSAYTGCAGDSASEARYTGCKRAYNTANGMQASTTGNIYGVYDMSGGTQEFVAAYVNNNNAALTTNALAMLNAETKYKDIYSIGTNDSAYNNFIAAVNKKGDAIFETANLGYGDTAWYNGSTSMIQSSSPIVTRGGLYDGGAYSGIFAFGYAPGSANNEKTSRAAIIVQTGL